MTACGYVNCSHVTATTTVIQHFITLLVLLLAASDRVGLQELVNSSGVGGRKDILPIKNSSEAAPTAEARVLVCRALQQALYAAVDYLRECDDMDLTEDDELA